MIIDYGELEVKNIYGKLSLNKIKYKGDTLSLDNIRDGLTIAQLTPKVSIFRPYIAKYLVNKYLDDVDSIFDPCAGYSGRMLGDIPDILTADEWIDVCLDNYKCKSYLFVVDKTEKYKNYIVEEIINKPHFNKNTEKVILINRAQKG